MIRFYVRLILTDQKRENKVRVLTIIEALNFIFGEILDLVQEFSES